MYVLNPEIIDHKIGFKEKTSNYLENHGVPLLAIEGGIYYYRETSLLADVLKSSPLWVRLSKRFK